MRSYLEVEGVYDNSKRYLVNNWTNEDFTQNFGSENVYNDTNVVEVKAAYSLTIKAGEMRELGQFEAYIFTKHLVDREIMREASTNPDQESRKKAETGLNSPEYRKPFENKTISEVGSTTVNPFMESLRAEIRAEELAKLKGKSETSNEKRFCDQCDSKGVSHKKECPTRNQSNTPIPEFAV